MKKWIISAVVLVSLVSLFLIVTPGKSRLKSYYSGDAIAYQSKVYVATTNTGSLEIFRVEGQNLELISKTKPYNARFNKYEEFFDVKLSVENNKLYAYVVSHYTVYKYQVSGSVLTLDKQVTNSYWEWYNRVDKFGDKIVTVSAKGIKVLNSDLNVLVAHDFKNEAAPYNLSGDYGRFFLNIDEADSSLKVYDSESRTLVKNIPLNFKFDKGNRRAYQDASGYIYVVDDYYAKKFDMSGKLLGSFQHLDFQGFDMSASGHTDYVYFSNGVGVVKLDKNMKLNDYAWTGNLGGYAGWAMGLKVVHNGGDKVVVFNNTNILVLNDKLEKVASTAATEEADSYPVENMYLRLDKPSAAVNSDIMLTGGGFLPYEQLDITFDGKAVATVTSDANGRFSVIMKVPNQRAGGYDIKASGANSKLHYSISFQIQ